MADAEVVGGGVAAPEPVKALPAVEFAVDRMSEQKLARSYRPQLAGSAGAEKSSGTAKPAGRSR